MWPSSLQGGAKVSKPLTYLSTRSFRMRRWNRGTAAPIIRTRSTSGAPSQLPPADGAWFLQAVSAFPKTDITIHSACGRADVFGRGLTNDYMVEVAHIANA